MDSRRIFCKLTQRRHQGIISSHPFCNCTARQRLGTWGGKRTEENVAGHLSQVNQLQDAVEQWCFVSRQNAQDQGFGQMQMHRVETEEILHNVQAGSEGGHSSRYIRHSPSLIDHVAVFIFTPNCAQQT